LQNVGFGFSRLLVLVTQVSHQKNAIIMMLLNTDAVTQYALLSAK